MATRQLERMLKDIERREEHIYFLIGRALQNSVIPLKNIVEGKKKLEPDDYPQPIDLINMLGHTLTQLLTLTHATFRELKKTEKVSDKSKSHLTEVLENLEKIHDSWKKMSPDLAKDMEADIEELKKALN